MHAVMRSYSGKGAKELFDLLDTRKAEIETALRQVKSFKSYTLMRSADGGISLTVCGDKSGTDESLAVARDWIAKNAGATSVSPPNIAEGDVIIHAV